MSADLYALSFSFPLQLWPYLSFCWEVLLPPATKLGQYYVFTHVCDSVHGGAGGSVPLHAGLHPSLGTRGRHPPDQASPSSRHPQTRHTPRTRHPLAAAPPAQCMLGDTANKRVVRILLECNLVCIICNVDGCRICGVQFHDFITMIVALNCQLFLFVWDCKVVDFLFLNEAVWSHCLVCNI